MNYPTIGEVNLAGRLPLARWSRFLPSPGSCAIGGSRPTFDKKLKEEKEILDLILKRFDELGGMTPSISKQIGW